MFDIVLNEKLAEKRRDFDRVFCLDERIIIKTDRKDELMKRISSNHSRGIPVIVLGSTDEINRKAVEDKRVDMLLSPEENRVKDFVHWRSSGMSNVLCKLASANNIKIGISFSAINSLRGKDRALRIGRIMQNVRLCRKYKTKLVLATFAKSESELISAYSLKSIGFVLGMTPDQVIASLKNAEEIFS